MKKIIPVILAGGSGTRLWPLSREMHPKQFLRLMDEYSLLQNTLIRTTKLPNTLDPIVICNQDHYFLSSDQISDLQLNRQVEYILEPIGRNTAPAIAMAALLAQKRQLGDAILLVFPADHLIKNEDELFKKIAIAIDMAEKDQLITFGIVPTAPKTGYGYIASSQQKAEHVFEVERFIEKPDRAKAEEFLKEGNFYWNSGMFAFKADTYLKELKAFAPDIYQQCETAFKASHSHDNYLRLDAAQFAECRSESIDYAVMEKTLQALVIPLATSWSDLGCWSSVAEAGEQDENENIIIGDVVALHTKNSLLSSQERLICAIGIQDQIVVSTPDAILVAHKDYSQEVKALVQKLKDHNPEVTTHHKRVFRPWGYYESLSKGDNFQVKHITVKPASQLSLQMHQHRAEHWVVVSGTAEIVVGDETKILTANQSTYIPKQTKHRLSNKGIDLLEIIEVQTGDYLGEDDIVRFEDIYGRATN